MRNPTAQADFPPIVNQQHNSSSLSPNASSNVPIVEKEWTDIDDNDSNSSMDYSEVRLHTSEGNCENRRRMMRRTLAMVLVMTSVSQTRVTLRNVHIIDILSKEKVFSVKTKKGKFSLLYYV